jgi:hypothetical protein
MKTARLILIILVFGLGACTGCVDHMVATSAQSVLGVSVSENPATQLYEARLGLVVSQVAAVPTPTNGPVPDVIQEFKVSGIFTGGLVYQRLAVGSNAVSQLGAACMFAKDGTGNFSTNWSSWPTYLLPKK